jgi:hypothetical protein
MKSVVRVVAMTAALCLVLLGSPGVASAAQSDRIGEVKAGAMKVRIDGAGGADRWVKVDKRTKVLLVAKGGKRSKGDLNDLVRGAHVVGKSVAGGRAKQVTLRELGSTGGTDCSFDSSEGDGDHVGDDDSFECSTGYDDGEVETESDCVYESELDGPANDWSMDTGWECSYGEDTDGDSDALEWECAYGASAGGEEEAGEGAIEAELEFECGWSGAATDSALWDCRFRPGVLGFTCVSAQLGQEFGYTIDLETARFDGGMDFSEDVVNDGASGGPRMVDCEGSAAGGYQCEVEGEIGAGNCEIEWEYERSRATADGDVSGELAYSCEWESAEDEVDED